MTNTCVVMVTVSSRVNLLNDFLVSMREHQPGLPIAIHIQDPHKVAGDIVIPKGVEEVTRMVSPQLLGCHASRVMLQQKLQGMGFDSYVNVDDDVTLMPTTKWQPAIDKALEPGNGFVLTNWVRHPNLYAAAVGKIREEFLRQIMVYNGGGMAYGEDVAALIRELDTEPARFDDLWPLTAYINGYVNWRYRGSLSVHTIRQPGGMREYMRSEPRPLTASHLVNYEQVMGAAVGRDVKIALDNHVKKSTKELHKKVRAEKGWA